METTEPDPTAALITLDVAPIPLLNLEGKLVTFKNDPLADQAWADLVGLQTTLKDLDPANGSAVAEATAEMKRILGEFVVGGKTQWDKSKHLGLKNLTLVLNGYVKAVTDGIPT